MTSPFKLKEFELVQQGKAWKVGTDSLLLGSWCRLGISGHALDMGTGSGILALMLAQRNPDLRIDAVDISGEVLEEARANIRNSIWSDRIRIIQGDLAVQDWGRGILYDLIISNPPYFPDTVHLMVGTRNAARKGLGFSLATLPSIAAPLLAENGTLCVIVPASQSYPFLEKANDSGLYVSRRMDVRHSNSMPDALVMFELTRHLQPVVHTTLVIYHGNAVTQDYHSLCGDFLPGSGVDKN
jgi:tRNA1Val (adenine37-N6)-methyltransferase